jgi:hypothetical protein
MTRRAGMRGWRRLGIVLSVFWFVGFGFWLRQADFDSARKGAVGAVTPVWAIVIIDAFVLAVLWLLAWMVVAVGRWVAAGFQQQA